MVTRTFPGVFVEEVPTGAHPIPGVPTSEAAFVDFHADGPQHKATKILSPAEFEKIFGGRDARSEASFAIEQFFLNGGKVAWVVRISSQHEPASPEWIEGAGAEAILGSSSTGTGIYALEGTGFNILCLPAAANLSALSLKSVYDQAAKFCHEQRAFLIVDVPPDVDTPQKVTSWMDATDSSAVTRDENAAVYFPRLIVADPLSPNGRRNLAPSGTLAGIYARTDETQGVWKAPAGDQATLRGVDLAVRVTDDENGKLNPLGINVLRTFPTLGNVVWGARTLAGADQLGSEWKYIPVRRTALFIESSIYQGTRWVVYEPNGEPLWAQIRRTVNDFMQNLFRRGAFQGATSSQAYFVKCDQGTTTQNDIDQGVVNILVGFAPLKPAEFVIIQIQQMAGHAASA